MPYRPYHEYLRDLLKQHDAVDGFDDESAFMRDASQKLLRLAEHADACLSLQKQRLDVGTMAREIGLPDDGPTDAAPKPAEKRNASPPKARRKPRKNRPWTEKELAFLDENYDRMTAEEISRRLPGRTPVAIRSKSSKLRAMKDGPRAAGTDMPGPTAKTGVPIPDNLSDLDVPARLKAVRLYHGATVTDVASRTGISKKAVYDVENGVVRPDDAFMDAMAAMYDIDAHRLLQDPIGDLVPIRPDDDVHRRLKAVRCRRGMSVDVLARRMALRPGEVAAFETDTVPDEAMVRCLATALDVATDLLRATNPA